MESTAHPLPARPRLVVLGDAEAMSEQAAMEIAATLERARAERGVAHVALSGGTTPVHAYELLAERTRDWTLLELWFADERCVPPEDEQSNYRLVAGILRGGAQGAAEHVLGEEQIHRMEGELGPRAGAERYAQLLRGRLEPDADGVPALDLAVLGIGPEGHIASLFPDTPALADTHSLCIGIADSPKPPPERITLSLPVLRAARRCLLLASGEGKARALVAALGEPSASAPASLLPAPRLTVLADEAAAALAPAPQG
jgi:6-phosphogluconolactonase